MSLALSMICARMVNNCCFGDLLMSEVLPVTGGEGQYTQWVHCELIVGSETICPAHTQQVSGGHFYKVPSTKPSGYFLNELTLFFHKVFTMYPGGIL